ncbi:ornithine cyclodeaminase family protein [Pendulispora brunnea]|uniref:Ornithine cyclodeaminase family protein n=1 Tax=Pendulispora brunnea TaxID=2905690 RepID=A0ABZ2K9S7_9BACT
MAYEMLVLGASDVRELFDWDTAIASQRRAFAELGGGGARLPEKIVVPAGDDMAICMAARMSDDTGPVSKFISVHMGNPQRGLPSVQSVVTALDPIDGRPVAILDGNEVTTRRTAAASAVAVSVLGRQHTHGSMRDERAVLAVIGSGVQGIAHIRAIGRVQRFAEIRLWSPTRANCEQAANILHTEDGLDIVLARSAEAAVAGASVIVACTSSVQPVVHGAWLSPGSTLLSVGSFTPERCEIDEVAVQRSNVLVVDHVPTEVTHGGPIVKALALGHRKVDDLVPLADVVLGRHPGRRNADEIIVYNSVGIGVQDAAAAWTIIERARTLGRGKRIEL